MKKKKGFLDISFSWIFAIIVGAIILGGTIYGLSKFTDSAGSISSVKGAKQIEILLDPLESSFESIRAGLFTTPVESRIYSTCYSLEDSGEYFGRQGIKLSEKLKGSWSKKNQEITFSNKYLFSKSVSEGKVFHLISKPFKFPFKVASIIYLIPSNKGYCFIESPSEIEEELEKLYGEDSSSGIQSIRVGEENCKVEDTTVCFSGDSCDILVNYNEDYLTKREEKYYFHGDALMFAAIFSDKRIYDCQVGRLMKRTSSLIEIYLERDKLTSQRGCTNNFALELQSIKNFANDFETPEDFEDLSYTLEELESKNRYSECALW